MATCVDATRVFVFRHLADDTYVTVEEVCSSLQW